MIKFEPIPYQDIQVHKNIKIKMRREFELHLKGDDITGQCADCSRVVAYSNGVSMLASVDPCPEGRRLTTTFNESRIAVKRLEHIYLTPQYN